MGISVNSIFVTLAKARVQIIQRVIDSGLRRNDDFSRFPLVNRNVAPKAVLVAGVPVVVKKDGS